MNSSLTPGICCFMYKAELITAPSPGAFVGIELRVYGEDVGSAGLIGRA